MGVGSLDRRLDHGATEILFGDDAIGAELVEGRHRAAAPDDRRVAQRAVGENIGVADMVARGDDDADLVPPRVVRPGRARGVDRHHHRLAVLDRNVVFGRTVVVDDLEGPQRIVDRVDVDAVVEALAVPLGQGREAVEEGGGEVVGVVARVEEGAREGVRVHQGLPRDRIPFVAEHHVRPMRLGDGVQVDIGALHQARHDLREAGEGDQRGFKRDLRGLVEEDAGEFEPEDLLDALVVVEAADDDLGSVFHREISLLPVFLQRDGREAELHDLRQRISRQRGAGGVGVEAQHRVTRARVLAGAFDDRADDEERLARARPSGETGRALRPVEQQARGLLRGAELHHAALSIGIVGVAKASTQVGLGMRALSRPNASPVNRIGEGDSGTFHRF